MLIQWPLWAWSYWTCGTLLKIVRHLKNPLAGCGTQGYKCKREIGVKEKYTSIGNVQTHIVFSYSTVAMGSFTQTLVYIAQYFLLFYSVQRYL